MPVSSNVTSNTQKHSAVMVERNMGEWTYNLVSELKSLNMIFKILQIWLFCNSLQFYIYKINK